MTSQLEKEAREWIEETLHTKLNAQLDLLDQLQSGVILCRICKEALGANIRYKESNMPFVQMENISAFINYAQQVVHVPSQDMFQTSDLFERRNDEQVLRSIHSFSRYAAKMFPGKVRGLGPKLAEKKPRVFSAQQQREFREGVNSLQYGSFDMPTQGTEKIAFSRRRDPTGNMY
ncbi:Transgelin [Schizosaccharomyces pombe]|uniref:Transgelin n=1 Tax=Schizosaccharomyces pombe (strain 972 / ATCC 24843) TaxID=284812 RepID=STG1_SCHPO|nr:SM22/transgelin-like actin-modulating protein Stg1 [Schizosaccharomyces pombe]O14185.1 RecName: Full=Transgelin; AltName: Full=Calponin homolog 1 [Schizosaccharomyces pombe 972h-]CAB11057.1 SM22/transgelin-like actin modulating protein Stg1 [Schizosaccharomyces pombe]|eukprot:NP_593863.1 SM22/transgelin-like actin-modulating protein Stg1 [Schizosaccharomyces pombe]